METNSGEKTETQHDLEGDVRGGSFRRSEPGDKADMEKNTTKNETETQQDSREEIGGESFRESKSKGKEMERNKTAKKTEPRRGPKADTIGDPPKDLEDMKRDKTAQNTELRTWLEANTNGDPPKDLEDMKRRKTAQNTELRRWLEANTNGDPPKDLEDMKRDKTAQNTELRRGSEAHTNGDPPKDLEDLKLRGPGHEVSAGSSSDSSEEGCGGTSQDSGRHVSSWESDASPEDDKVSNGEGEVLNTIQLQFSRGSFSFFQNEKSNRKLSIKLIPLPTPAQVVVSSVEIAVLQEGESVLKKQNQFGQPIKHNEFMIFQIKTNDPDFVGYQVLFYNSSVQLAGVSTVLSASQNDSVGELSAPIFWDHKDIGKLTLRWLIIRPYPSPSTYQPKNCHTQWDSKWKGMDIGHRGCGSSYREQKSDCANVLENTIASFDIASKHGADFVEFDVQVTKDGVPVIFHDFHVMVDDKRTNKLNSTLTLAVPIKDLTLTQLQTTKLHHHLKLYRYNERTLEDHRPFPTLQQALEEVDPLVGFNIEIKWTMELADGTHELDYPIELNLFINLILDTVFNYTGSRKIIFSCFHPDVCTMLQLKQSRYPVVFLTQGVTSKWPAYRDERCASVQMAAHFAQCAGISGVCAHAEDLLRDNALVPLVKRTGLVLLCWGDDCNDPSNIEHLKSLGVDGVIYDKIDEIYPKDENIFQAEARQALQSRICRKY